MSYCKNQTSLFYLPNPTTRDHFELQDWGWSAFIKFDEAMSAATHNSTPSGSSTSSSLDENSSDLLNCTDGMEGFLAHNFKLYLVPGDPKATQAPRLPGDLTPERLVVDYLRCLTDFIMDQLKCSIRNDLSMEDVQWCLTVPAIWDEKAKQLMRRYAQKAGMIRGPHCPKGVSGSPRPLHIILEPEAASAYCQDDIGGNVRLRRGDRVLIADVGGGTIDLVLHEILETDAGGRATKVKEVVPSYGEIGGGTFVDAHFFELLNNRIGCFNDYCRDVDPAMGIHMFRWWQGVKIDFDGSADYSARYSLIRSGLDEEWMHYDRTRGIERSDSYYWHLFLDLNDFKVIFDPEVNKVLDLINKQIDNVRVLIVVGGFAGSQYLRRRIRSEFEKRVPQIILPIDPGRAICRGAVGLCMRRSYIQSRISRRTYGVCAARDAEDDDPEELIVENDNGERNCIMCFSVYIRKGEEVEMGQLIRKRFQPMRPTSREIKIIIYSSPREDPKYIVEDDVMCEGSFEIDISSGLSQGVDRVIEVTMVFGDSLINVSAIPLNFGTQEEHEGLAVTFEYNQLDSYIVCDRFSIKSR
ncbi:hypothetical protein KP509_34G014000 [Ceratopteris richardii]|nr:hypothetical protein KP509_34G014000 [Ceratopteris richardii]